MQKRFFIIILAFLSATAPLATDMYLPALNLVKDSFNTSEFYIQLSISSFFTAFAIGQLFYGVLSDVYGRKTPLIIGLMVFAFSSILCIFTENIYIFIFLRFMQALGGCAGVVIARAIVSDIYKNNEAVAVFSLLMICTALAPMLSPSIGALLLKYFSWESIFITLFLIGIVLLLLSIFYLKESNHNKISLSMQNILNAYKSTLNKKSFMIYTLNSSLIMASLFTYIAGSSFVFISVFELSSQAYALIFGANSLGYMIFARLNIIISKKLGVEKTIKIAIIIMLFNSILLVLFSQNLYTFTIFLFLTLCMLGFITPNMVSKAMGKARKYLGTASAIFGAMQFIFAGFATFLVGFTNSNTSYDLAFMISIFCLISCILYLSKSNLIRIIKYKI